MSLIVSEVARPVTRAVHQVHGLPWRPLPMLRPCSSRNTPHVANTFRRNAPGLQRRGPLAPSAMQNNEEEFELDPARMGIMMNGDGTPETNVWKTKPAWCQPWTIVATGAAIVGGSFAVFHSKIFSGVVSVPIVLWWYLFLGVMPGQYADYVLSISQGKQSPRQPDLME